MLADLFEFFKACATELLKLASGLVVCLQLFFDLVLKFVTILLIGTSFGWYSQFGYETACHY